MAAGFASGLTWARALRPSGRSEEDTAAVKSVKEWYRERADTRTGTGGVAFLFTWDPT